MKTTEDYLDDYLDKYNLLKSKNELWRLKHTPQEFLKIVERAKRRTTEDRERKYFAFVGVWSFSKYQIPTHHPHLLLSAFIIWSSNLF